MSLRQRMKDAIKMHVLLTGTTEEQLAEEIRNGYLVGEISKSDKDSWVQMLKEVDTPTSLA